MKVLMLGWEYPPHISGGLGTACEGLTTALSRLGLEISFVVPRLFGGEDAPHMNLIDSTESRIVPSASGSGGIRIRAGSGADGDPSGVTTYEVPSLLSPYLTPEKFTDFIAAYRAKAGGFALPELFAAENVPGQGGEIIKQAMSSGWRKAHYGYNMFHEVARFAGNVANLMATQDFDVIHCHDWMTFPAGVALQKLTGKPLVTHVHSLEYDRSGEHVNQQINEIERFGMNAADMVVGVSYYTASLIHGRHGVPLDRIGVVHNGVYSKEVVQNYRRSQNWPRHVVLFLGRITFQKGPDYFVEAAARVIPHVPDVLFVMAGSGDMLPRMINRVGELGIGQYFHFPGFLKGEDVERMFSVADLYVMPSVSEPFGISALEAISFDTPVIISRQSGVSEVLSHALKVDFWDLDRLADLIINALIHDELRDDMVSMAREEVKRLHWDAAALKTLEIYQKLT
jgi:glycosyltransferase involved in cell wall biosynthesis